MNIRDLKEIVENNLSEISVEYRRLFHGRGNCYDGFEYLTIDSIDKVLYICFFKEIETNIEKELIDYITDLSKKEIWKCAVLQRRYLLKAPSEVIFGELDDTNYAIENGLKYKLSFLSNQNIGFFGDMSEGRAYIKSIAKDKNILNLFSYTSSFSVVAMSAEAQMVVNVDMSKGALSVAKENHEINNISTNSVKFLPFNILKSWSKIRKFAPYDAVIIDPPSFQKGSFIASNDYVKIIKKLPELCNKKCMVLATLNAPELDESFLIGIFKEFAPEFKYIKRLDNPKTFPQKESTKALKNLIFERVDLSV